MKSTHRKYKGKKQPPKFLRPVAWIAAVFVLALLLSVCAPGLLKTPKAQDMELSVIALGEEFNMGWESDVLIESIVVNETPIDLTELAQADGWEMDGDLLVADDPKTPTETGIFLKDVRTITVNFYGQEASGLAEVRVQGRNYQVDLYHPDGRVPVVWEYQSEPAVSAVRVVLVIALSALLCALIFGLYTLSGADSKLIPALQVLFLAVMLYINAAVIFFAGRSDYACKIKFLMPNQVIFLLSLLSIGLLILLSKLKGIKMLCPSGKAVALACVVLFFAQIYLCFNYFFMTGWDPATVYEAAMHLADGTFESAKQYNWYTFYVSAYPNNRLFVFVMTVCMWIGRIFGTSGPESGVMVYVVLSCAISTVTGWLLYRCLCMLLSNRWAFWGWLAYTAYIWLSPWTVIPYSDSLGLAFPVLIYYLYLTTKNRNRLHLKWAAIAFTGGIAYKIKPQAAIILIAIVLCEIVVHLKECSKKKTPVRVAVFLVPLVFALLLPNLLMPALNIPINREQSFGMPHYVMMGLNPDTRGIYSEEDFQYSTTFITSDARTQGNLSVIQKRLSDYGVGGYLKLLHQKTLTTYADGTFAWGMEGNFWKEIPPETGAVSGLLRSIYYRDGELYPYFRVYSQLFWVAILFLNLFSSACPHDKNRNLLLPVQVGVLGLTAFELLFETRARYLYTFAPLFLLLAVIGLHGLTRLPGLVRRRRNVCPEDQAD